MKTYIKQSGFTIVELLIVIVIIGILAAIAIVSYSGVTARARDSDRLADLTSVQVALEAFFNDNGGYPLCYSSGANKPLYVFQADTIENCLTDDLVPKYISSLPKDPSHNGAQYAYRYGTGYKKETANSFKFDVATNNYILGTKQESVTSPSYSGWGQSGLTLLMGSDRS